MTDLLVNSHDELIRLINEGSMSHCSVRNFQDLNTTISKFKVKFWAERANNYLKMLLEEFSLEKNFT